MTNEKIVEKLKQTDLTKYQNLSDLFDMARHMEDYDLNGEVWRLAAKVAREKGDLEFYDLYKRSLLFAAPHRFDEYMLYLEFNRDPDKKFYVPRRSVLKPVVDALQDLEDDKLDLVTISMPPGVGKLLADDTPVLTTNGWKNHGDLVVGDYVFNHNGDAVKVTHVFPKNYADYEVEFANGEVVKCHGEHEWVLWDRSRNEEVVVETKYLSEVRLTSGEEGRRGHRRRFLLPLRKPLAGVEKEFHVPPYTLGVWLGDGTTTRPYITIPHSDGEVMEGVKFDGYKVSTVYNHKTTGCPTFVIKGLRRDLQKYGMCHSREVKEKRIPEEYLTGSINQRLDLLAGLIDTDGTISGSKYQWSTISENLRDDFMALVSTFGWRVYYTAQEPCLSSSGIQGRSRVYTVGFTPDIEIPCRLDRKRIKQLGSQRKIGLKRVTNVDPVSGNCIEVEGGIYLVGKSMIPTHNSTLAIFYLSWIMGRCPDMPNLASGHSSILTTGVYDGVMAILEDPVEYLWHDVFPSVQLVDKSAKFTTVDLNKKKRFPTLTCRSIDGSLTGATRCEKLLYSDDLVSGIEEALSKERLDKLWEKYTNDLKSRKKLGCKELHIATRWSVHDPIGRLERIYGDDPRARFIGLPALNERRESNFNYSHGVGFDTKYFLDMEATLDEVSWKALFMNEPIEREGLLYKADELRRYYELPSDEPDAILGVCDTAEGGGDYTFLPVVYVYGNDYYIEDCVCDNGLPEVTDALCAEMLLKHNVKQCQFESNSAGGRTADKVQELVKAKGGVTHITKKRTTANKLTKIIVNSDFVKKRFLFKDASRYSANSPYGRMMHMMCSFTVTGKNKNDDVPDGLAQLAEYGQSLEANRVEVFKRPF